MKKLTEGNPLTLLITFAIPILLGNIFQQLYSMVDIIIVSKTLGTTALAGVGATQSISGLIIGFTFGINSGFTILTAQYYGAGKIKEMKRTVAATLFLSLVITIIMSLASLYFIEDIFSFMHTPKHLIPIAVSYISVIFYGMIFSTLYNMFAAILRAIGNSVAPLIFLVISALLNIGFDYLFVCILSFGVEGAAFATVLSQAISALLCFVYIIKKCPELHISREDFDFGWSLTGKMLSTGLSMAMMYSIVSIGSVILQSGINGLGETTIAAHTTARKLLEMLMMPLTTVSASVSTFSGQNYGAGLYDRVHKGVKSGFLLGFAWSTLATLIVIFFAEPLIVLIGEESDEGLIRLASRYLHISVPFFYGLTILVVLRNVLQGMGRRILPLFVSGTELFGKVLAIRFLVPRFAYTGVCITEPIIWVADAALVLLYYLILRRKLRQQVL